MTSPGTTAFCDSEQPVSDVSIFLDGLAKYATPNYVKLEFAISIDKKVILTMTLDGQSTSVSPLFTPPANWPVAGEYDLVVAGAGPGGFAAAIAAARAGVRVAIVDQAASPGGTATHSNCPHIMGVAYDGRQIVGGIADQLLRRLSQAGQARMQKGVGDFEPEPLDRREITRDAVASVNGLNLELSRMLEENGVEQWFYTRIIGATTENHRVTALAVDPAEGPALLKGKFFVDATGDAHLAWRAGARVRVGRPDEVMTKTLIFDLDGAAEFDRVRVSQRFEQLHKEGKVPLAVQDRFMGFRCLAPGKIHVNYTATVGNALDSRELTRMDTALRRQVEAGVAWFKSEFPEFKNACLAHVPDTIGLRAGRSAVGRETITQQDIDDNTPVAEPVGLGLRRYGDHGIQRFAAAWRKPVSGLRPIPWRTLIAGDFINLGLAGRTISCETKMITCIRYIAQCLATGQAAGSGVALALADNSTLPELDYSRLASHLKANGAILQVPDQR